MTDENDLKKLVEKLHPIAIDKVLIRVGSDADGGYVVPNDLDGMEAMFSPGVGGKLDFDMECAKKGMKVYMADASVEGPLQNHSNFNFTKKYIGAVNNHEFMSIEKWVDSAELSQDSDLMLQMDIEGYEYEAIYSIPDAIMKRFRVIIIEFHQMDMLFNNTYFEK